MRFAETEQAIHTRWATEASTFVNTVYGKNHHSQPPQNDTWAWLVVNEGQGTQVSLGASGVSRLPGVVTIQLFGPLAHGSRTLLTLADTAAAVFHRVQLTAGTGHYIKFLDAGIVDRGEVDKRYSVAVNIPYRRDVYST